MTPLPRLVVAEATAPLGVAGRTLLKNEAAFDFAHRPSAMPGREEEHAYLVDAGRSFVEHGVAAHTMLSGPVGTGKTATALKAAEALRAHAATLKGKRSLHVVVVNCRRNADGLSVMHRLVQSLVPAFPDRGFKMGEVLDAAAKQLLRKNANLLLILDEAQFLAQDPTGVTALNLLTRMGQDNPMEEVRAMVWLVAQTDARGALDEATLSTFGRTRRVTFAPYDQARMLRVVKARAEEALARDALDEGAAVNIARRAATKQDVRLAIELLHQSACVAARANASRVTLLHVRVACGEATLPSTASPEATLRALDAHARALRAPPAEATTLPADAAESGASVAVAPRGAGATPERAATWRALHGMEGGGTVAEVALVLGTTPRNVQFQFDALVRAGLVRRVRKHGREHVYEAVGSEPEVDAKWATRDTVYAAFTQEGPSYVTAVAEALGLSLGLVNYHTKALVEAGRLVALGRRGYRRYYGAPGNALPDPTPAPAATRTPNLDETLAAFRAAGRTTTLDVAERLQARYSTVHRHAAVLEERGRLARVGMRGRRVVFEAVA